MATSDASHKGLLKLMLRLPALRSQLRVLCVKNGSVQALCEAYEDATVMLDQLRRARNPSDADLLLEYQNLCSDIEAEIREICVSKRA
jgi:hypothetical protein